MSHGALRLLPLVALLACGANRRLDALEARLASLEAALGIGEEAERQEAQAMAILESAMAALERGDHAVARDALDLLVAKYASTQAGAEAARMVEEVAALGRPAGTLDGTAWLQGSADFGPGLRVVVFWELWCPYCQRFVPELQALHEQMAREGVVFAGLTRLSRGVSEADTLAFVQDKGLTYAMGVVPESVAETFAVSGIPAAAVVHDGEIVWRGHPMALDEALLRRWMP